MVTKARSWTLIDGDERHAANPKTWGMPSQKERLALKKGAIVKVGFVFPLPKGQERIWYRVTKVNPGPTFCLKLMNEPLGPCPKKVTVETRHIIDIWDGPMPD